MSIEKFSEIGVINAHQTGDNELELDIVCLYCGDKRATVTIKYESDKDQGLFRAKCICEKCRNDPEKMKRYLE